MKKLVLASVVAAMLSGCAANDPNANTKGGAGIGAIAGALIGHAINGRGGAWAGAVIGGLAGAATGSYMDKQKHEMDAALAQQKANNAIQIEKLKNDTLKINITNEISFDFNSAAIKPAFQGTLAQVADILKRYPKTVIHVVGYTDSIGSAAYNQKLSEQRAQSVTNYFMGQGVSSNRLFSVGRGETQPRASNMTEAGRQLNRRVEIYVKPIIEGQEAEAYKTP